MKRTLLTAIPLLVVLAACGGAGGSPTTTGGPTTTTTTSGPTTTAPSTTSTTTSDVGGFFPFQTPGDSLPRGSQEMRPTFRLGSNGCWTAEMGFDSEWLIAFPADSVWGGDHIVLPDGLTVTDGLLAEARGAHVYMADPLSTLPEPWAMLAEFCGVDRLAVLEEIEPAFQPGEETAAQLADRLRNADLARSWNCGWGFTQSDEAGRVRLVVMAMDARFEESRPSGVVSLPDPGWSATVDVGAHLMVNHCDDVFEDWEPEQIVGAEWPIVAGSLEFTDVSDGGGYVTATLTGIVVETGDGLVELADLDLVNTCWGCFAG